MMDNKVIFVTGGCGYIGSHIVKQLSQKSYKVIVYDNLSTGFADSLLYGETLIQADLNDQETLDRAFAEHKPSAALHFAASIVVPDSISDPLHYYRNNTVNTVNLLDCCKRWKVDNFIFSSTAAVYGEGHAAAVDEESVTQPTNPYGRSKLMDEQIIQDMARAGNLRYIILRYFNVAGADPQGRIGQRFPKATHLIKVACEAASAKRPYLEVFGEDYPTQDGTCIRDYIHIEDLASAHVLALEYLLKESKSHVFNCGYGHGYSVKEVIDTVKRVSESNFEVRMDQRRPGDVAQLIANSQKIRNVLHWVPQWGQLEDIVGSAWRWEARAHRA